MARLEHTQIYRNAIANLNYHTSLAGLSRRDFLNCAP